MKDDHKLKKLVQQAEPLRLERRLLRMERSVLEAEYRSYPKGLRQLHQLMDTLEAARIRLDTARHYLARLNGNDGNVVDVLQRVDDAGKKLIELEGQHRDLLEKIAPLTEADLPPLVQKRQALRTTESRLEELDEEIDLIELAFWKVVSERPGLPIAVLSPGRCKDPDRLLLTHRFMRPRPKKTRPGS